MDLIIILPLELCFPRNSEEMDDPNKSLDRAQMHAQMQAQRFEDLFVKMRWEGQSTTNPDDGQDLKSFRSTSMQLVVSDRLLHPKFDELEQQLLLILPVQLEHYIIQTMELLDDIAKTIPILEQFQKVMFCRMMALREYIKGKNYFPVIHDITEPRNLYRITYDEKFFEKNSEPADVADVLVYAENTHTQTGNTIEILKTNQERAQKFLETIYREIQSRENHNDDLYHIHRVEDDHRKKNPREDHDPDPDDNLDYIVDNWNNYCWCLLGNKEEHTIFVGTMSYFVLPNIEEHIIKTEDLREQGSEVMKNLVAQMKTLLLDSPFF